MLHVLFILLKIIGIILALLLCLLVIFLAVPIRYSFQMEKKDAEPFWGQIKVTWLFSVLYLKASYIDKVFDYRVRIFGYQILGNQEEFLKKKEEKEQRKREKEKHKEEKERQKREKEKQKEKKKKGEDELKAASLEAEKSSSVLLEDSVEEKKKTRINQDSKEKKKSEKEDTRESNKDSGFAGKKKKAKSSLKSLKNKVASLRENVSMVKSLYGEYHGQELIALAKKSIIKLLRHVLPVRLKGLIRFGFNDPATTGLVTGMAAIFYPKYHKSFSLEPDFQTACFETECKGRGRIRIGYFLYIGIYILLNKDIRRVIKLIINN